MSVDPYALCPCGSGKKLKFCCADLAHEIEKIHRMLEGDQPRAALNHLKQTLRKAPGRGSLLDLKATLEISLEEWDEARATVADFTRLDPKNPAAHAQAAILAASHDGADAAVDALQDAMELLDEEMPARVLQAIGEVGQELLIEGKLVAAKAHLWLYQGISGGDDTRAMELLTRLNRSAGLPLLLRDGMFLREAPAGHAAEAEHDRAQMLASRGQWRRAAKALDALCERHADLPALSYNRGLVYGWLGDTARFVQELRRFAEHAARDGAGLDDAVEATAIASLLDTESREAPVEVLRTTFAIADEEALIDRVTRDGRTHAYQLEPSELAAIEGPPPRGAYLLLDRELPMSGEEISAEQTPRVIGALSYYGRRTDKPERLELVSDRNEHHTLTLETLKQILGDALGEQTLEEPIGRAPADEPALRPRLQFPADTPIGRRREVLDDLRREGVLNQWIDKPRAALGDRSPRDCAAAIAAERGALVALSAEVLNLEQSAGRGSNAALFTELRELLGLPSPEPIDPASTDFHTMPLTRLERVDLAAVDDDDFVMLYERAALAGAESAQLRLARAALDRPTLREALPREDLYYRVVSLEPDPAEAVRWLERAREEAESIGKSSAPWDILELELAVINGQMEDANRLVEHVRREHLNEPGVAQQLYQLLYALGAVPEPGAEGAAPGGPPAEAFATPSAEPAPASGGSKLWTPGDGPAAPAEPPSQGGSKIWTPT